MLTACCFADSGASSTFHFVQSGCRSKCRIAIITWTCPFVAATLCSPCGFAERSKAILSHLTVGTDQIGFNITTSADQILLQSASARTTTGQGCVRDPRLPCKNPRTPLGTWAFKLHPSQSSFVKLNNNDIVVHDIRSSSHLRA